MTDAQRTTPKLFWQGLLALAILKLVLHYYSHDLYGLHRDEYLYLAEGDHLAWGYLEVPPMIAVLGKLARGVLGDTIFAVRFFPALVGGVSIFLVGMMARDFGGRKQAQLIAGAAFLFSPAYLGSNNLFQPVSFNQFCWLLSAFLVVRIIKYQRPGSWYVLGVVAGLGFLTKYSIVFFLLALAAAFLISKERKQLLSPHPYLAVGLALLIASPNLYWQYSYDWPIIRHMEELARTQLVYMTPADFLVPQLIFHWSGVLVWGVGLWALLREKELAPYRLLAWAFLFTLTILLLLSGKAYYTIGAYGMLLAAGGVVWERWLGRFAWTLLPAMLILNAPIIPYGLPLMPVEKMQAYSTYFKDNYGLTTPLRWEDGVVRSLPQDFADMHGWDELPAKVATFYHSLTPEQQSKTMLYADNYGQAGVLNFHRKEYGLPECLSFSSSFTMWIPQEVDFDHQLQVYDEWHPTSEFFAKMIFIDSIEHPLARDPGYIFFKTDATMDVRAVWKEIVKEEKMADGIWREE